MLFVLLQELAKEQKAVRRPAPETLSLEQEIKPQIKVKLYSGCQLADRTGVFLLGDRN